MLTVPELACSPTQPVKERRLRAAVEPRRNPASSSVAQFAYDPADLSLFDAVPYHHQSNGRLREQFVNARLFVLGPRTTGALERHNRVLRTFVETWAATPLRPLPSKVIGLPARHISREVIMHLSSWNRYKPDDIGFTLTAAPVSGDPLSRQRGVFRVSFALARIAGPQSQEPPPPPSRRYVQMRPVSS
jgi:hypothetical protein